MITAHTCREHFTAEDFEFLSQTLTGNAHSQNALHQIFSDTEIRDGVLDDPRIYSALVDSCGCLKVSTSFYFYIITRKFLQRFGISERDSADYVASVLATFSNSEILKKQLAGDGFPSNLDPTHPYISDMLQALQQANSKQAFLIRMHIANYALFFSGVFSEKIAHQHQFRGGPDISFYENMGKSNFHFIAHDKLALQTHMENVLESLSEQFHTVRLAINELSENVLHFAPSPALLNESS